MTTVYSLSQLGWSAFFQQQLNLDECEHATPARVLAQHRNRLALCTPAGGCELPCSTHLPEVTVGDWLLLGRDGTFLRRLERTTRLARKAPGSAVSEQLIAANVDTLFVVTALNRDFSLNRIERYLALCRQAGATPVVLLTKSDLCTQVDDYIERVQALDPLLAVMALDSRCAEVRAHLAPWCQPGQTLALLGSSGVGKSTLSNTLLETQTQETAQARALDDKGRHTTTSRSLHVLPSGALLLDTPGMRELQLGACERGVEQTFAELSALAAQCRFADCGHLNEPGCALLQAQRAGELEPRRLESYLKLQREQARNGATLAQQRARDKAQSRYYRSVQDASRSRKKGQ
ncbi:MAG: ribosome small subunit-dependent GTPase A [Pseudomonadales bacterium]